jgi:hypothetical protein
MIPIDKFPALSAMQREAYQPKPKSDDQIRVDKERELKQMTGDRFRDACRNWKVEMKKK